MMMNIVMIISFHFYLILLYLDICLGYCWNFPWAPCSPPLLSTLLEQLCPTKGAPCRFLLLLQLSMLQSSQLLSLSEYSKWHGLKKYQFPISKSLDLFKGNLDRNIGAIFAYLFLKVHPLELSHLFLVTYTVSHWLKTSARETNEHMLIPG